MIDPTTLSRDQLVRYVQQLQRTVQFWQTNFAATRGQSREAMLKEFEEKARQYGVPSPSDEPQWMTEYPCEFVETRRLL